MGYKEKKDSDASIQGTLIRELIGRFTSYHLIGKKIKNGEFRKKITEPAWNVPDGFTMTEIPMDTFAMEWLTQEGSVSDYALLQLHGGGYVGKLHNAYRNFAHLYSQLGDGMSVLTAGCWRKDMTERRSLWQEIPRAEGLRLRWSCIFGIITCSCPAE